RGVNVNSYVMGRQSYCADHSGKNGRERKSTHFKNVLQTRWNSQLEQPAKNLPAYFPVKQPQFEYGKFRMSHNIPPDGDHHEDPGNERSPASAIQTKFRESPIAVNQQKIQTYIQQIASDTNNHRHSCIRHAFGELLKSHKYQQRNYRRTDDVEVRKGQRHRSGILVHEV